MHIIPVAVDDKSFEIMLSGRRVEGTIGYDQEILLGDLNAFKRRSREPGYVKPGEVVLAESASGWLRLSIRKFKMYLSANRGLGRQRGADELLRQAEELCEYLRTTKTIFEIMDEV